MLRKHLRLRRRLFVGLAFAALAAPAAAQAQSGVFVDGGPLPVSTVALTNSQPSYLRYHEVGVPVAAGPVAQAQRSRITPLQADGLRWQAMARFYEAKKQSQAASERSSVASTSNGFDWRDAGIGASTVFAAALLLGIALLVTRRHHDSGLTSA